MAKTWTITLRKGVQFHEAGDVHGAKTCAMRPGGHTVRTKP